MRIFYFKPKLENAIFALARRDPAVAVPVVSQGFFHEVAQL